MGRFARYGRLTAVDLGKRLGEAPARPQASPRSFSLVSQEGCGILLAVDVTASEFPFVESLPKREAKKVCSFWTALEDFVRVQRQVGAIAPAGLVAKVLNVHQTRISQLVEAGLLERVEVEGRGFITERSVRAYAARERQGGRPPKGLSVREALQAAWSEYGPQ
jgi:hypothetical protein